MGDGIVDYSKAIHGCLKQLPNTYSEIHIIADTDIIRPLMSNKITSNRIIQIVTENNATVLHS